MTYTGQESSGPIEGEKAKYTEEITGPRKYLPVGARKVGLDPDGAGSRMYKAYIWSNILHDTGVNTLVRTW